MNDALLSLTLVLVYGPFFLMLGIFAIAGLLHLSGRPDFLAWLIAQTSAQQPKPKESAIASPGRSSRGDH